MATSLSVFVYPDPVPSAYAASQVNYDMSESSYNRSSLCTPIQDEVVFSRTPSRCCVTPASPPAMEISRSDSVTGVAPDAKAALLQQYFRSTGALARSILLEKASVEEEHSETWSVLSDSRKDAIVDSHFVPLDIREQYEGAFVGGGARRAPRLSQRRTLAMQVNTGGSEFERNQAFSGRNSSYKLRSMKQSRAKTDSSLPSQTEAPGDSPFARNKLRSYSMRLKNGRSSQRRRQQQLDSTGQEEEIIPLFERDVADLDTGVDLPDETLLTDHISGDKDVSFGRMKPLRFSVGRKLRNKVDTSSPAPTPDSFVISNHSADLQEFPSPTASSTPTVSPNATPIHTPMPTTPLHVPITTPIFLPSPMQSPALPPTPAKFPDFTPAQLQELRLLTGSPVSHDVNSTQTLSRASMRSPDSTGSIRGRGRTVDMGLKHPLSRSTKAGSSLTSVTSDFADRRQQFKAATMKRRAGSSANTPATSPVPSDDLPLHLAADALTQQEKKPSPLLQTIPVIRHEADIEDQPQSPICSPPDSPAGHSGVNRRESGYMSSTCDHADASDEDEDEMLKPLADKHRQQRRRHTRPLSPTA